jgi:hypothetical protein
MRPRSSVCVVIAIAFALAACRSANEKGMRVMHPPRNNPAELHIAIFIFKDSGTSCAGVVTPSYLPVQRKDTIVFDVVNLCDAGSQNEQNITVASFTGDTPGNKDPLDKPSGSDKKKIVFTVRDDAKYDVYKYTVTRGNGTQVIVDPEIDVER